MKFYIKCAWTIRICTNLQPTSVLNCYSPGLQILKKEKWNLLEMMCQIAQLAWKSSSEDKLLCAPPWHPWKAEHSWVLPQGRLFLAKQYHFCCQYNSSKSHIPAMHATVMAWKSLEVVCKVLWAEIRHPINIYMEHVQTGAMVTSLGAAWMWRLQHNLLLALVFESKAAGNQEMIVVRGTVPSSS